MNMQKFPRESVASSRKETICSIPWRFKTSPKNILVIRLQAFGDVVITLPYVQALQAILPSTQFQFLTREEFSSIPCNMTMFKRVLTIGGGRNAKLQWLHTFALLPSLLRERFDIVIDLQRNSLSRMIRRALHPKSYCEFDRFSTNTAGARTKITIDKLGFPPLPDSFPLIERRDTGTGLNEQVSVQLHPSKKLFVLNPAGSFVTKNWPLDYYVQFARAWLETIDSEVQFAVIGIDATRAKAEYFKNNLGDKLISLVGLTTQAEAFNILQTADLVLTEDSGLMHMAWISRIPVIALFGSTKSAWSKPIGEYSVCLDSSDLDCGECTQPACRYNDVHCLTRHTPDRVITIARELLQRREAAGKNKI